MTVDQTTEYRGRKQKVGSVLFTETGRLQYFLGYCPNCHGKCSVTPEEARTLIRRFGKGSQTPMQRVAKRMLQKYASDY